MKAERKTEPGHLAGYGALQHEQSKQTRESLSKAATARYSMAKLKPIKDLGWRKK